MLNRCIFQQSAVIPVLIFIILEAICGSAFATRRRLGDEENKHVIRSELPSIVRTKGPTDERQRTAHRCGSQVYALLKYYYERSPVNLSIFTGITHIGVPRLVGGICGRFSHIERGGLLPNLEEAAQLAASHPTGACQFWLATSRVLLITKPAHIKQVLVYNNSHISRNAGIGDNVARMFGQSLFFDDGDVWKSKRQLWKRYIYLKSSLESYAPIMQRVIRHHLFSHPLEDEVIDIGKFFTSFTLDIIGQTLMRDERLPFIAEELSQLLVSGLRAASSPNIVLKDYLHRIRKRIGFKSSSSNFESLASDVRIFFCREIIEPNLTGTEVIDCLLRAIVDAQHYDEADLGQQRGNCVADILFMVFAGHATTAATFQFAIKLLAANPDKAALLREALQRDLGEEEFTLDDVESIDYLDWVIKETLRLFPPVPILSRGVSQAFSLTSLPLDARREEYETSLEEYSPSSLYLARGTSVVISPYILHRSADYFEDPDSFIPERFEDLSSIPSHTYIPFGTGPRQCLGRKFAIQELKLMLATLYSHYDVEIIDNSMEVDPHDVTLTPLVKPMGWIRRL